MENRLHFKNPIKDNPASYHYPQHGQEDQGQCFFTSKLSQHPASLYPDQKKMLPRIYLIVNPKYGKSILGYSMKMVR